MQEQRLLVILSLDFLSAAFSIYKAPVGDGIWHCISLD